MQHRQQKKAVLLLHSKPPIASLPRCYDRPQCYHTCCGPVIMAISILQEEDGKGSRHQRNLQRIYFTVYRISQTPNQRFFICQGKKPQRYLNLNPNSE